MTTQSAQAGALSPTPIPPYYYPQPLFGGYGDPFYGMSPPISSFPPWWGAMSQFRLGRDQAQAQADVQAIEQLHQEENARLLQQPQEQPQQPPQAVDPGLCGATAAVGGTTTGGERASGSEASSSRGGGRDDDQLARQRGLARHGEHA